MNMQPVKSSNIESIAHDPQDKVLLVKFTNGTIYRYDDVSAEDHKALVNAESIGRHFGQHIRGKFKHTKV